MKLYRWPWPYRSQADDGGEGGGGSDDGGKSSGDNGGEDDAGDDEDGEADDDEDAGEKEADDAGDDEAAGGDKDGGKKPKSKSVDERLERLRLLEEKMEKREAKAVQDARFRWLKNAGIKLPRDLALKVAPDVDPDTPEGEQALIAFAKRADVADVFDAKADPRSAQRRVDKTLADIEERQKGRRHKNRLLAPNRMRALFSEIEE